MKKVKIVVTVVLFFLIISAFSLDLYIYNQMNRRDITLEKQILTLSNQVFALNMRLKLQERHKLTNSKTFNLGGIGNHD